MCLIWKKPQGVKLHKSWLKEVYTRNDDGWGISWVESDGKVKVLRGLEYANFERLAIALEDRELLCHVRMATHGKVCKANAHPFKVHSQEPIYLMHNGVVDYPYKLEGDESDTVQFCRTIVQPILEAQPDPAEFVQSTYFNRFMRSIGGGKYGFISPKGITLIDEHSWNELDNGVKVSNTYSFSQLHHHVKNNYVNNANRYYGGKNSYGNNINTHQRALGWYGGEHYDD